MSRAVNDGVNDQLDNILNTPATMSQIPTTADLPRDTRDPDPVTTPRYPPPPAPAATTATTRPPPVTATANNLAGNQVNMQAALASANGDPLVALETILADRNNLSAQNSQLWKIIEKQRGMYNSLHKELDRVKAERDRLQTRSPAETSTKRSAAGESASRKQVTRSQSEDRRESQYSFCTFSTSLERRLKVSLMHPMRATVRISPADMLIITITVWTGSHGYGRKHAIWSSPQMKRK